MISTNTDKLILVVDDQNENVQIIGNILSINKYRKITATSGAEALEIAIKQKPHLILLDIMMPKMDGYEVCRRLKENDLTKDIPVIFLTAKTETEDIVKGFNLGGVDYITKPFNHEELIARIQTQLELKRSRDIIIEQNARLKQMNHEKNEFLSIAAHDLKNPLQVIVGFAKMLEERIESLHKIEIKDIAKDIKDSGEAMFRIINDLLIINAAEEGRLELDYEKFNINKLISSLIHNYTETAGTKNITLKFETNLDKLNIEADAGKTYEILDNLISNAIKFSPFGKNIWIRTCKAKNVIYNCNTVLVKVQDEGPGIDSDDMKKLFVKFAKLKPKPTNNESSTRLGLSIAKMLVEMMKGRIWCESDGSNGATFIFELPVKKIYEGVIGTNSLQEIKSS